MSQVTLTTNGLPAPVGFPVEPYHTIHSAIADAHAKDPFYEHFSGAWNALAYRFRGALDSAEVFTASINSHGASPEPIERYSQERALFDFFSAGFAVFEATFYGLFAIGAMRAPTIFALTSQREQQHVSPARTKECYTRRWPTDPIVGVLAAVCADEEYQKFREIRNVLTHRTAPGRRIYVSIGDDDAPPVEWKLNNMPLDATIVTRGGQELSRLTGLVLEASASFLNRNPQ